MAQTSKLAIRKASREAAVRCVVELAIRVLQTNGTTERLSNASRCAYRVAEIAELEVLITTPFTRVNAGRAAYRYTLTIYDRSPSANQRARTLLAVAWDPKMKWADPLRIFQFKRGAWIDVLSDIAGAAGDLR